MATSKFKSGDIVAYTASKHIAIVVGEQQGARGELVLKLMFLETSVHGEQESCIIFYPLSSYEDRLEKIGHLDGSEIEETIRESLK